MKKYKKKYECRGWGGVWECGVAVILGWSLNNCFKKRTLLCFLLINFWKKWFWWIKTFILYREEEEEVEEECGVGGFISLVGYSYLSFGEKY